MTTITTMTLMMMTITTTTFVLTLMMMMTTTTTTTMMKMIMIYVIFEASPRYGFDKEKAFATARWFADATTTAEVEHTFSYQYLLRSEIYDT